MEISASCKKAIVMSCYLSSWHLIAIAAIYCISLFGDCLNRISSLDWKIRTLWVPVYVMNTLYLIVHIIIYKKNLSPIIVSVAIFSAGGAIFSIIGAVERRPTVLINPPTKEYTAGLLSYLTFSYINKDLVDVGMNKESLELEDVPGLIDGDSCSCVYKVKYYHKTVAASHFLFPDLDSAETKQFLKMPTISKIE